MLVLITEFQFFKKKLHKASEHFEFTLNKLDKEQSKTKQTKIDMY